METPKLRLKDNVYLHCQEIAHSTGLEMVGQDRYMDIWETVENHTYAEQAAFDVCKLLGVVPSPTRLNHVTLAIKGNYQIPK